uniref:ORF3 n=1 Tax=Lepus torque teno virus 1 TaxID=2716318 RepID=A0A6G7NP64_9VIRU|nr:ORF3 [Lepus torque teno virus 1]
MNQTTTPAVYFGNKPISASRRYRFVKRTRSQGSVPSTAGKHREPRSHRRSCGTSTSENESDYEPSFEQMQREYAARRREKRRWPETSSSESGSEYSSSDTEPEGPKRLWWPKTPCYDTPANREAWAKMAAESR